MSEQLSIWDMPSLNPVPRVKEAMRISLKNCAMSREQVVDVMNNLARHEGLSTNGRAKKISLEMLDKWVSHSGEHIIPWKLMPIFCKVVKNILPMQMLVAPLGAEVINRDESRLLQWAKIEKEARRIRRAKKQIEIEIAL